MTGGGGQVHRTHRAELDIVECAVFLAESSDEIAWQFVASVEETAGKLLHSPLIGRAVERPTLADRRLRWWPISGFPNHLIFYREVEDGIQIVRVLHGARDWPRVLDDE